MDFSNFTPVPKPQPKEKKEPKAPRKKNLKRSSDSFERAYHSQERVEFINGLPCHIDGCQRIDIENAHIEVAGMSLKASYDKIVPACRGHHRSRKDSMHSLSREEYEGTHLVDLAALAAEYERMWRRYSGNL